MNAVGVPSHGDRRHCVIGLTLAELADNDNFHQLPQFHSMSLEATGTCLLPPKGGHHSSLCWTPVAPGSSALFDTHHAAANRHSIHVGELGGRFHWQLLGDRISPEISPGILSSLFQFQPRPKLDGCQRFSSSRPQPKFLWLTHKMKLWALTRQQPNWSANADCAGTSSCALSSTDGPRAAPASCGHLAHPLEES